jgi:hypothetical protein
MEFAKKNDKVISLLVLLITGSLIFVVSRNFFLTFAHEYRLLGGFIKFFLLASIGDFVGLRVKEKQWKVPKNMILKAFVWGIIGIFIVMMFTIFPTGVTELQVIGILPFSGNVFFHALFTSIFMNIIFAPTMMFFHRISDTMLNGASSISEAVKEINWDQFVHTVLFKTIPLFWIPAHTITFLIPKEYQVILAAVLGIFLGLLLSVFKK